MEGGFRKLDAISDGSVDSINSGEDVAWAGERVLRSLGARDSGSRNSGR
jgi:hypothetical protein